MLHLFNIFRENKDSDNCAKVLEEECIKMFGTKSLDDEHDGNVVSVNSLDVHGANDMQSYKLGNATFDLEFSLIFLFWAFSLFLASFFSRSIIPACGGIIVSIILSSHGIML